jgi:adenylate cyclase
MPKLKVTVRFSIVSLSTVLVILSSGTILSLSYLGTKRSIHSLGESLMREISAHVVEKTLHYLNAAFVTSKISSRLSERQLVQLDNTETLVEYFKSQMLANEQFLMFNYGKPSGDFIMLKRMADNTYSIKTVTRQGDRAITQWQHENPSAWAEIYSNEIEPSNLAYDPRKRPWYEGAIAKRGFIWTDVYIFYSDRQPGISGGMPIYDRAGNLQGVFSIDISLANLSYFLNELEIGKRGKGFIFNQNGQIVALPIAPGEELKDIVVTSNLDDGRDPENYQFLAVERASDRAIAASFKTFQEQVKLGHLQRLDEKPAYFPFQVHGNPYLAMYSRFPEASGLNWSIGIVVPERDFMESVDRYNRIAIAVSYSVMALAIAFGVLLANTISQPLSLLAKETEKIKEFKLDTHERVKSFLIEVEEMAESFENMVKGLRSFKKYVPASLVRELISREEEACLGGEQREITIYFSDIADFTAIAENLRPEELVESLGEYISEMSKVIHRYQGTVDKYIGDAIMAFWGAPLRLENHALLACQAALATQRTLDELSLKWQSSGKTVFRDRIGISTGEAIVGNMGTEHRLNYTAIGDSVNLASRLEGLNKYYGTDILISESTYQQARDYIEVRLLDFVAVKGKTKPVAVYELIDEKNNISPLVREFIQLFDRGVNCYRDRQWQKAIVCFQNALKIKADDRACEVFIKRCYLYQKNPPPDNWQGVFVWRPMATSR